MRGPRLCWWLILGLVAIGWLGGPSPVMAENIYLMSTGNAEADTAIINALQAFGHTVTLGVEKQNFDGSQSLVGYKVVLLTDSYNWNSSGMPDAGQTALLNFVNQGGGLITGEWILWARDQFAILAAVFPTFYGDGYSHASPTTYTRNVTDPIMNANLPVLI